METLTKTDLLCTTLYHMVETTEHRSLRYEISNTVDMIQTLRVKHIIEVIEFIKILITRCEEQEEYEKCKILLDFIDVIDRNFL